MKILEKFGVVAVLSMCGWIFFTSAFVASGQGTAITYQGRLTDGGIPANGNYDFQFILLNAATNQVGAPLTNAPVAVSNGLFTVSLDFGYGAFDGSARRLEIGVRPEGSVAPYTILNPLQQILPAPYAVYSANAQLLNGLNTAAFAPASGSSTYVAKSGDTMTGTLNLTSSNPWLNLVEPGVQNWTFNYADTPELGSTPTLQIGYQGSGLDLDLSADPGAMRLYLWPPGLSVPNMPHTGVKPTLAVYGDLLIGDIICIQTNPMTLFMREATNLPATAVTQLFSARAVNSDSNGGAGIVMSPDQTGAVQSGYMSLTAYGRGTAPLANSIIFQTRSGPNAVAPRMVITGNGDVGIGTTSPAGTLDVNGSIYQRGSVLYADYVFSPKYKLPSIEQHAKEMWSEKHLPALSGQKVDKEGREVVNLGTQQRGIIAELEEAHIYIEQLNGRVKSLQRQLNGRVKNLEQLNGRMKSMQRQLNDLKQQIANDRHDNQVPSQYP